MSRGIYYFYKKKLEAVIKRNLNLNKTKQMLLKKKYGFMNHFPGALNTQRASKETNLDFGKVKRKKLFFFCILSMTDLRIDF